MVIFRLKSAIVFELHERLLVVAGLVSSLESLERVEKRAGVRRKPVVGVEHLEVVRIGGPGKVGELRRLHRLIVRVRGIGLELLEVRDRLRGDVPRPPELVANTPIPITSSAKKVAPPAAMPPRLNNPPDVLNATHVDTTPEPNIASARKLLMTMAPAYVEFAEVLNASSLESQKVSVSTVHCAAVTWNSTSAR